VQFGDITALCAAKTLSHLQGTVPQLPLEEIRLDFVPVRVFEEKYNRAGTSIM
jgi:hypothetical protein